MRSEIPVRFGPSGDTRIGVIHLTAKQQSCGVLIIVGGWQYRVGSHRQFVLLSRALAAAEIPSMRFDARGIGDSDGIAGEPEPAEHLSKEIGGALDIFASHMPENTQFILCGLCDGASAALTYAPMDKRVRGLILLNPWVSSKEMAARAELRRYYWQHLLNYELWYRIITGRFKMKAFVRSLLANIRSTGGGKQDLPLVAEDPVAAAGRRIDHGMADALDRFTGRILVILSGRDLTAARYAEIIAGSARWRALLRSGQALRLAAVNSDHTFSGRASHEALVSDIVSWMHCL
jgi:uncharacterized protein